ncbi:MAG: hypothetical protein OXD43_00690 [Bacteroidetes bacterium]|nr:hypothetical protein [Bacteroidota bacterium]
MVLLRKLWMEVYISAEEKNCRSEIFKFSVPSTDRFDLLDLPIDALRSGIGLFMAKGITHACEMSFKHLRYFHDLLHGRFFYTFKPSLEILLCIGQCFTFKDRLELLSQPPGDADLQVGFLDDFENFVLFCV